MQSCKTAMPDSVESYDLLNESDQLKLAQNLFVRYLEDKAVDSRKAQTRLIAGIQVALGEAISQVRQIAAA